MEPLAPPARPLAYRHEQACHRRAAIVVSLVGRPLGLRMGAQWACIERPMELQCGFNGRPLAAQWWSSGGSSGDLLPVAWPAKLR